jgi:SNF2 family DNA or RNA helicase
VPFVGDLYPFQAAAVKRMVDQRRVLLAMDMGLGKTVAAIAAIERLLDDSEVESGLVIVLSSLKYQWRAEIERFTAGRASTLVIDGSRARRLEQYAAAREGRAEYVILNYEQVVNDWDEVRALTRHYVVCDECTAIKSFQAKRSRRVKLLRAEYHFGLTGQPIENRAEEVYSIMQWVEPRALGRYDLFDQTFIVRNRWGGVTRYKNLPTLHRTLSETMIRHTREEVADQLPMVTPAQNRYIEFDRAGAALYRRVASDLAADISRAADRFGPSFDLWRHYTGQAQDSAASRARGVIMGKLTCLRMLCDHPGLLGLSAGHYDRTRKDRVHHGSAYASQLAQDGALDPPMRAVKLAETVALVEDILSERSENKIVLFAFFRAALVFLQEATRELTGSVRFHGGMNSKDKEAAKLRFQRDPGCRLFLSSDAGGYGVDLPQANYVLNYDLPWSAGRMEQRNARVVRLSSEFERVFFVNMLMRGSIEERQRSMLERKGAVASAVVDGEGIDASGGLEMDLGSLAEFLSSTTV